MRLQPDSDLNTYITTLYDATLLDAGAPLPIGEVRERIRGRVARELSKRPHDWEREAEILIRHQLTQVRNTRSRQIRDAWQDVVTYLHDPANEDLNIRMVANAGYKLGDGRDMTLKFWTPDDVANLLIVRRQETDAHVEATRLLEESGQQLTVELFTARAGTIGALLEGVGKPVMV